MDNTTLLSERLFGLSRLVVTAALGAVTLLYFALLFKMALADVPQRKCGGESCPRGFGWLALFTALLGAATVLLWKGIKHNQALRRSCLARALAVVVALAALWPGWLGYEWMRGPQMDVFGWQAPDRPSSVKPVGVWKPEGSSALLVRARTDALIAFNGEGRTGWRLPAPDDRTTFCALSRTTSKDLGVVAYGPDATRCGQEVAGVDIRDGRMLWRKDVPQAHGAPVVAVGTTAVVVEKGAVVGLDLRAGTERWRVAIPEGCRVEAVDGAGERVLYVEECTAGTAETTRLTALDAGTGTRAWQSTLPVTSGLSERRVVSAQPIAIHVKEGGGSGTDAVLLFDDTGRQRGAVPETGPEERLLSEPPPLVSGDLLITPVRGNDKRRGVSAYSLTDGHRVWHADLGKNRVRALTPGRAGEVDVVTSSHWWNYLSHLELDNGKLREESTVLRDLPLGERFEFYKGPPGDYVFVNLDRSTELPPIFDIDPVIGW
ncbi:outer membrane protein assembly factor BamB family protein [Streptomyces sp. NPDC003042]